MANIEHDTCPNCKEWGIDETGVCTECGYIIDNYALGRKDDE